MRIADVSRRVQRRAPQRPVPRLRIVLTVAALAGADASGAKDAVPSARFLSATAECSGPRGAFRTTVHSAADGRVRLEQAFPDGRTGLLGVDSVGIWSWDEWTGAAAAGSPAELAFVRGHEFHALALWPESRLGKPLARSTHAERGQRLEHLEYRDALGARIEIRREVRTGRVQSLHLTNPAPTGARDITVTFGGWEPVDGVDVFRVATLMHGGSRWEYRFTGIEFEREPDAAFRRPPARTDAEQLLALHESALRAHRRSDPEELLAPESDAYVVANRGLISHPEKSARQARFADYLGRTRFRTYQDLVPPEVRVSSDGSLGWVLVQVRAEGDQTPAGSTAAVPVEFTCAWIELYEKRDGRWWRTGNVSNFLE